MPKDTQKKTLKLEVEVEIAQLNIDGKDIEALEVVGRHNGFPLVFKVADKTSKIYIRELLDK